MFSERSKKLQECIEQLQNDLQNQNNELNDILCKLQKVIELNSEENQKYHDLNSEFQNWAKECIDDNRKYHDANTEFQNWARGRFDDNEKYHDANTEFQNWARGRFDDNERYHDANTEFQNWARARFDDNERYHNANTEFQNWTRARFDDNERYHDANTEFQEWARLRIDTMNEEIQKLYNLVSHNEDSIDIQKNIHNKKTYSQSGEDAIISYVLNFIGKDLKTVKYLDLGANHAKEMSNSYAYYENGASGVLVEANPELIDELQSIRPRDIILNKAVSISDEKEIEFYVMTGDGLSTLSYESAFEAMSANPNIKIKEKYIVPTITINEIVERYFMNGLDIMSVDLEGIEETILKQFDFSKCRPTVIVLENIPYHPYLVIDEREDKAGELLRNNNYVEYAFTGINSIYLDRDKISEYNQKIISRLGEGK